jgi:hypothetical protein
MPGRINAHVDWGLEIVRLVLDAQQPENLIRESVTVTGRGPAVGLILLPHQDLGGYSLMIWVDERHVILKWAGVTDLKYHDEIDLGQEVVRLERSASDGEDVARAAIATEIGRPIHASLRKTRIRRRWQLWCAIQLSGRWRDTYASDVKAPEGVFHERTVDAGTTSLLGPGRPLIRQAVPLAAWHRWTDPAWPRSD